MESLTPGPELENNQGHKQTSSPISRNVRLPKEADMSRKARAVENFPDIEFVFPVHLRKFPVLNLRESHQKCPWSRLFPAIRTAAQAQIARISRYYGANATSFFSWRFLRYRQNKNPGRSG